MGMRAIGALRIVAFPLALMPAAPAGGLSEAEKVAPGPSALVR